MNSLLSVSFKYQALYRLSLRVFLNTLSLYCFVFLVPTNGAAYYDHKIVEMCVFSFVFEYEYVDQFHDAQFLFVLCINAHKYVCVCVCLCEFIRLQ